MVARIDKKGDPIKENIDLSKLGKWGKRYNDLLEMDKKKRDVIFRLDAVQKQMETHPTKYGEAVLMLDERKYVYSVPVKLTGSTRALRCSSSDGYTLLDVIQTKVEEIPYFYIKRFKPKKPNETSYERSVF